MIDWREEGVVLAVRKHGETSAIVEALTPSRGRHLGVVRGGAGRRMGPLLQPGAQLDFHWRARIEDHLGAFVVEPVRSRAALLSDPLALAGLGAIVALLSHILPEREPQPRLYAESVALMDLLQVEPDWMPAYLAWELALLEQAGFGLDLSACAISGETRDLAYISPRTGRAVARGAAGDWAPRLLPLPPCLLGLPPANTEEVLAGLAVTGHFLETHLAPALGDRPLPAARARLVARLARQR